MAGHASTGSSGSVTAAAGAHCTTPSMLADRDGQRVEHAAASALARRAGWIGD